jgi:ABC-type branched-subunit amino acid transport system substrate-binding protein
VFEAVQRISVQETLNGRPVFAVARLDDRTDTTSSSFEQGFLDVISRDHVVAIIAANRSATAPALLRLAETFRIPTLITVATTDAVFGPHTRNALRLVPTDSKQAEAISTWASSFSRLLLIYHDSEYGEFLSASAARLLERNHKQVLRTPSAGAFAALSAFLSAPCAPPPVTTTQPAPSAAVVYAGYSSDLPDVLRALAMTNAKVPLLVTDGCYSDELTSLLSQYPAQRFLSFPVEVRNTSSSRPSGFGPYGEDAAILLMHALADAATNRIPRERLMDSIQKVIAQHVVKPGRLAFSYSFDFDAKPPASCENQSATFTVQPF